MGSTKMAVSFDLSVSHHLTLTRCPLTMILLTLGQQSLRSKFKCIWPMLGYKLQTIESWCMCFTPIYKLPGGSRNNRNKASGHTSTNTAESRSLGSVLLWQWEENQIWVPLLAVTADTLQWEMYMENRELKEGNDNIYARTLHLSQPP